MARTSPCYVMLAVIIGHIGYCAGDTQCKHSCQSDKTCDFRKIGSACYYVFKDKQRNWFDSREFCVEQGLTMAKLTQDMIEHEQAYDFGGLFDKIPEGFKVSGVKSFAWLGGREIELSDWTFLNNVYGEREVRNSNYTGNYSLCGLFNTNNNTLQMDLGVCNTKYPSFCRFNMTSILRIDSIMTWFEARSHCIKLGGDLFYMYVGEGTGFFEKDPRLTKITGPHHIGLRHMTFEWIDGSEILFTNWATNNLFSSSKKCLLLHIESEKWFTWHCKYNAVTVCQGEDATGPNNPCSDADTDLTAPILTTTAPRHSTSGPNYSNNQAGVIIQLSQLKVLVIILGSLFGVFQLLTISLIIFIVYTQWARKSPKPPTSDANDFEMPEVNHYVNEGVLETNTYETLAK